MGENLTIFEDKEIIVKLCHYSELILIKWQSYVITGYKLTRVLSTH